MSTNFPTSKDDGTSLPNPTASSATNSPSHAGLHDNTNAAIIAVESKLGTGASTPTNNTFLTGNGTGTSVWSKVVPTGTVVGTSDIQTLTNKTLTSPTINTAVIANPTLTVDTVSGFSSPTVGTVYGLSVNNGAISPSTVTASGLVTASSGLTLSSGTLTLPDGAIIPKQLITGTGTTWVYTVFSPATTGYSGTPTTTVARYIQIGKTVILDIEVTGTSNATTATFTLPVAPKSSGKYLLVGTDSGSVQTSASLLTMTASSTTASTFKTLASGAWTNSGTKAFSIYGLTYEAA